MMPENQVQKAIAVIKSLGELEELTKSIRSLYDNGWAGRMTPDSSSSALFDGLNTPGLNTPQLITK